MVVVALFLLVEILLHLVNLLLKREAGTHHLRGWDVVKNGYLLLVLCLYASWKLWINQRLIDLAVWPRPRSFLILALALHNCVLLIDSFPLTQLLSSLFLQVGSVVVEVLGHLLLAHALLRLSLIGNTVLLTIDTSKGCSG